MSGIWDAIGVCRRTNHAFLTDRNLEVRLPGALFHEPTLRLSMASPGFWNTQVPQQKRDQYPRIRIQPDVQFVISPADNPQQETAVVFELPLDMSC